MSPSTPLVKRIVFCVTVTLGGEYLERSVPAFATTENRISTNGERVGVPSRAGAANRRRAIGVNIRADERIRCRNMAAILDGQRARDIPEVTAVWAQQAGDREEVAAGPSRTWPINRRGRRLAWIAIDEIDIAAGAGNVATARDVQRAAAYSHFTAVGPGRTVAMHSHGADGRTAEPMNPFPFVTSPPARIFNAPVPAKPTIRDGPLLVHVEPAPFDRGRAHRASVQGDDGTRGLDSAAALDVQDSGSVGPTLKSKSAVVVLSHLESGPETVTVPNEPGELPIWPFRLETNPPSVMSSVPVPEKPTASPKLLSHCGSHRRPQLLPTLRGARR